MRHHATQTFSELPSEMNGLYELCKFDDIGRYSHTKAVETARLLQRSYALRIPLTLQ